MNTKDTKHMAENHLGQWAVYAVNSHEQNNGSVVKTRQFCCTTFTYQQAQVAAYLFAGKEGREVEIQPYVQDGADLAEAFKFAADVSAEEAFDMAASYVHCREFENMAHELDVSMMDLGPDNWERWTEYSAEMAAENELARRIDAWEDREFDRC